MNYEYEDFDSLLETSLRTYASPEPRPGLEQRILARTSAQLAAPALSPRRLFNLRFRYAGSLAAAVISAVLAVSLFHPHAGPTPDTGHHNSPFPVRPTQEVSGNSTLVHARHQPRVHRSEPHQAETAPLESTLQPTAQEVLLAQFVSAHRKEVSLLANEQARLNQPLQAAPINIQPIQIAPISGQPIVIKPIQISRLQLDQNQPPSF